jgi:hypothetical protein
MPTIPFPNVPNVPGVPAIPRASGASPTVQAALGLVQGMIWSAFQADNRWGIFDLNGKALADPSNITGLAQTLLNSTGLGSVQSTVGVEYSKGMRISDFPVERGTFASYNKVETPSAAAVTFAFTGSESDRNKFLDALDKATKSTDLYSVATPEVEYINHTIESYTYRRAAERGATLLIVDLTLKEVRQVSAQYTKSGGQAVAPKSPSAANTVTAGLVQASSSAAAVLQSVSKKITSLASSAASQLASAVK